MEILEIQMKLKKQKKQWKVNLINTYKNNSLIVLFEISQILNCGLDKQSLSILVSLCENGVNPEALSAVVKELKRESSALKVYIFNFTLINLK